MKYLSASISFIAAITFAAAVFALDLQTAKQRGWVGEQTNGYIGAVASTPEVQGLVSSINAQRKQAYQNISKANGQPLKVVETLAAKKLYNKLGSGEYFKAADGSWQRK